jgi:hypothetical protein
MMYGDQNAPVSFTAETNPLKRQMQQDSDSFSLFGKKMKKKDVMDILKNLSGDGSDEEEATSFAPLPSGRKASMPSYNPAELYGGYLSLYGGKKVRGGLLGD